MNKKKALVLMLAVLLLGSVSCNKTPKIPNETAVSTEPSVFVSDSEEIDYVSSTASEDPITSSNSAFLQTPAQTTGDIRLPEPVSTTTTGKSIHDEIISVTGEGGIIEETVFEDTFESFLSLVRYSEKKNDYYIETYFQKTLIIPELRWTGVPSIGVFRVVGIEPQYMGTNVIYLIQFTDFYGDWKYDPEKTYRMAWMGELDTQVYGRPPLEIGKTYARIFTGENWQLEKEEPYMAGLIYLVEENAQGTRYIYGYGADLSRMECKIKITDKEENNIYKAGKHDKAIAALKKEGQALPTFDYKCPLDDFYREIERRVIEGPVVLAKE